MASVADRKQGKRMKNSDRTLSIISLLLKAFTLPAHTPKAKTD